MSLEKNAICAGCHCGQRERGNEFACATAGTAFAKSGTLHTVRRVENDRTASCG
jgi:hypothetical protein